MEPPIIQKDSDFAPGFEDFYTFSFVEEDPFSRWPDLRNEKIGVVNTPEQLTIRLWQEVHEWTTIDERAKLAAAIDLAGYVDGFQVRLDGTPTITHPLRDTVRLVSHYGVQDIDQVIAMVLHDTVEDGSDIITKMAAEHDFLDDESIKKAERLFDQVQLLQYRHLYHQEQVESLSVIYDIWGEDVAYLVAGMTVPDTPPSYDKQAKNEFYYDIISFTTELDNRLLVMRTSDVTDNGVGLDFIPNIPIEALSGKIGRAYKYIRVYDLLSAAINQPDVDLGIMAKRKITHQLERGIVYAHMLIQIDSVIQGCLDDEINYEEACEKIDWVVGDHNDFVDNSTEMKLGAKQLLMNGILNKSNGNQ